MNSGLAFDCLPTTVWGRDAEFPGLPFLTKGQTKMLPTNHNEFLATSQPWSNTKVPLAQVLRQRKTYIRYLHTPEGREKLENIAPRIVDFKQGDSWKTEFDVDYVYLNDLEMWRQKLHAGTMTSQELLESGQMASFIPYLVLLGDWKALNAYFKGLLKVNVGLAMLLRGTVRELQLGLLKKMLEKAERVPPPIQLERPRPPTAPLAPPTLQSLA